MKEKKLSINIILNTFRVFINIVFPLITFPYVSRILEAEIMGKILFSNSIVIYFSLIASFGINSYAIREGANRKEKREEISTFASEIFTLNIITTLISIFILGIFLLYNEKFILYRDIIILLSLSILSSPFSLEWVNNVYEDFSYITKRTIIVQVISLILILLLINDKQDYRLYALILAGTTCITNLFNYLYTKKYIDLKVVFNYRLIEHVKVVVVFFVNGITSIIYLNSDTTMLGFLCGDIAVGIYGVASKIYGVMKQIINAVAATIIPRLAFLYKNRQSEFYKLVENLINGVFFITLPVAAGIMIISSNIINLFFGSGYNGADKALAILALTIPFAALANIFANGILIAIKKEKYVLSATMISAITNVLLNLLMLPFFEASGAAITTLIAEIVICIITASKAKEILRKLDIKKNLLQCTISAVLMFYVVRYIKYIIIINNDFLEIIVLSGLGIFIYFSLLFIMRNEFLIYFIRRSTERVSDKEIF